ncbi:21465_t:CDS:2 [Dentiscutata erythropus]|uniref:21465_t:CDS:1 n=1 Tax=Dentiscutata erythropus TaxID=1348616 RepID=A0A9N8WAE8_9GLOM|nr:21465_t:CDS:2 [Dentiscutata erythropus]
MGLSTQLISPSLAKLQLGSYFSNPKNENTSQNISTPDVNDKPNPIIKTDEKDQNSMTVVTNPHFHQRKKLSNKLNRKEIDRAIAFSAYAVEEDYQGNPDCALELYLLGLEHILKALPVHADQSRRNALKTKLLDFMDRTGLTDEVFEATTPISPNDSQDTEPSNAKISDQLIQAAVTGAVALKQSPIPDAISTTVNYTMRKMKVIDEAFGIQDKAWEISRTGINMALDINSQYNVHEKVVNGLFLGFTAAMKAGIAYTDSPSYRELKKLQAEFNSARSARTDSATSPISSISPTSTTSDTSINNVD